LETFLLTLMVIDGLILTGVVLLQSGKGGGLAAMGGGAAATEGIFGGRQAATVLTRATWTTGGIFMFLALVLAIISSRAQQPVPILRQEVTPATAPAPVLPGVPGAEPATPPATPPATTPATPDGRGGAGGAAP
jgi:preprotein translocase subunit SecG